MSLLNGYSRAKAELHDAERRHRAAVAAATQGRTDTEDASAKVSTTYAPVRPSSVTHSTVPASIRNIHAAIDAAYSQR